MNLFIPAILTITVFSVMCLITAVAGPTIALGLGLTVTPLFAEVLFN